MSPTINSPHWVERAKSFLSMMSSTHPEGSASIPSGHLTLYGTIYNLLARYYLGENMKLSPEQADFIASCQDPDTGLICGPELSGFSPRPDSRHDLLHLQLHSTCSALPAFAQFGIRPKPISYAKRFCDLSYLREWLDARSLKDAWFEGNNILFVGQLLVHLRDREGDEAAKPALDSWFKWLDDNLDPQTGLWGTNGFCSNAAAVYGGYHQLLVYYYENHPVTSPEGMIDVVLGLQHKDGGFRPDGNAGACEDVDSVDILVNLYKRYEYRRTDIRIALGKCLEHILSTQGKDGGFPYARDALQDHMGIPGTQAAENVSTSFPTWFRIHTIALISQILPLHPMLTGTCLRFSDEFGMGWHDTASPWRPHVTVREGIEEYIKRRTENASILLRRVKSGLRRRASRTKRVLSRK